MKEYQFLARHVRTRLRSELGGGLFWAAVAGGSTTGMQRPPCHFKDVFEDEDEDENEPLCPKS